MKKGLFVVGIIVVLLLALNNYFQINSLKQKIFQQESEAELLLEDEEHEDIELGDVMNKLQRHSNKLWFAGKAENWPLSAFYIHELEETFEELTNHEVIDEGVNITDLTKALGLAPLEIVEMSIKEKNLEGFKTSYGILIDNCNACHQSSNHPFVVIKTPTSTVFDNQSFEIQE